jgi:DNA-directed RNA polymerase specialized sigma24 family protein
MEGYTLDELATALDVPLGTLKSRLHRGRAHLRRLLGEPSDASERVYGVRTFA